MASPRWTLSRGFLVAGLLLPVVLLTILVRGFAWLQFAQLPGLPIGIVAVFVLAMAIVGVVAIRWPNAWLLLVGAVIAALNAAGGAQGDPGFLRPDRTLEFSYWWLTALLGVALPVAAVANLVQQRRGAPTTPSRVGVALVTLVVALYLGGLAVALQEKAFVPPAEGAAIGIHADLEANLTAQNDKWAPAALTIPAGKVVKLTIHNADAGAHVFNQDASGLRVDLPAGATKVVWLRVDAAGALQWYCELHSAQGADGAWTGMTGALTVT